MNGKAQLYWVSKEDITSLYIEEKERMIEI